jgi:outer membrane cobalamin receptor
VAGSDLTWGSGSRQVLQAGLTVRRVSDQAESNFYDDNHVLTSTSSRSGLGWKTDAYLQNVASFFQNRLHVVGSLRVDTAQQFPVHPVSPQISAAWQVARATQLQFGAGRYNQFHVPASAQLDLSGGLCFPGLEELQTSNHFTAAVEQRIGETTRIRAMFFDREGDRSEAVNRGDHCTPTFPPHGFDAFEHNHARGVQLVLQSRTANRLSGWIGYTLTHARESDLVVLPSGGFGFSRYFPSLADQRHTVNVFASYRLTPTVRVSGKFLFGSGFPIPSQNNATTLGDYQRLDARGEKDWAFHRWKLALYGEVLNVTNHYNPRYFYTGYNPDGTFTVSTGQGIPITPTAGVAFEF